MKRRAGFVLVVSALLMSSFLSAQEIPLRNWTVPPYHATGAAGGLTTMADVTPGIAFVGMTPCRLVDTTNAGFPATYGPPALIANTPRDFDLNNDPRCPGIPAGVDAYSLNITAAGTQGPGFIVIYPQGGAVPVVSTLNYVGGQTVANAAIVPAAANGAVTVIAGTSGTHLIIDINGYFTDQYNPGVSFHAVSSSVAPAILAENTSTVPEAFAIQGVITSATPGVFSTAVRAINNGAGYGVYGSSVSGFGVVATTGGTAENSAVYARNTSSTNGSSGVFGWANASSGVIFGGKFITDSVEQLEPGGAGVVGAAGGFTAGHLLLPPTGVRGEGKGWIGVSGVSEGGFAGVGGARVDSFGGIDVAGYLGQVDGYGVYSEGNAKVVGDLTVTGSISAFVKPFIQPHPFDASKQIRFVSLEGPHSEVYFRGTAQVSQGVTQIPIPEAFRLVASRDTYSTLVTPVGGMATVAVIAEGQDGIVIQASRNVKVHYVVYAEREAMKNPDPIVENVDFRPNSDQDSFGYADSYRRLMIQNGTLNPDGTVNLETARRLGWDREWEKRPRPIARAGSE